MYIIPCIHAIKEKKKIMLFSVISHFISNSFYHMLYAGLMTIRSVKRNNTTSITLCYVSHSFISACKHNSLSNTAIFELLKMINYFILK